MVKNLEAVCIQRKWAEFRFSVIGPLLANPPKSGETKARILEIAASAYNHPITLKPVRFSFGTIERWYYLARNSANPVDELIKKTRGDRGYKKFGGTKLSKLLEYQYKEHPSWSRRLHFDNLSTVAKSSEIDEGMPSYSTLNRWMKLNGFYKFKPKTRGNGPGRQLARQTFSTKETRSFEALYPGALWHLDFHKARRRVFNSSGRSFTPVLLAIMDDKSRLACHIQWYEEENTDILVHGFTQAIQKRGLPRELLNDNGKPMTSAEFTGGLKRLSITANTTLPYCPEQNGKQERFFGTLEGRLMAMLENKEDLTLQDLNDATMAWVELDYNRKFHEELGKKPVEAYLSDKNVHRPCPSTGIINLAFNRQASRTPRRFDATISLEGIRFQIPWMYRHLQKVIIRYKTWDLSSAWLMDEDGENSIQLIFPLDKEVNSSGQRKATAAIDHEPNQKRNEIAPRLKEMMAEFSASGMPYPYISKEAKN